jgi:hypothetical protein
MSMYRVDVTGIGSNGEVTKTYIIEADSEIDASDKAITIALNPYEFGDVGEPVVTCCSEV